VNKRNSNKIIPYVESISESTTACLLTMVQGNVLLLGLGHLSVALQTGFLFGILASSALLLVKTNNDGGLDYLGFHHGNSRFLRTSRYVWSCCH